MSERKNKSNGAKEKKPVEIRNKHPYFIWESIMMIPEILGDCLKKDITDQLVKVTQEIQRRNIQHLFLIGTAAGYFSSIAERYAFEALSGIPATALITSEFSAYPPLDLNSNSAVFFHSHSGGTKGDPDVVQMVKDHHAYTVGVTDVQGSPLANCVDDVIIGPGGRKPEMPATRTYSSALYRMIHLAIMLGKAYGVDKVTPEYERQYREIPGVLKEFINKYEEKSHEDREVLEKCSAFFVIGSGPNYATACESAISFSQSLGVPAQAYPLRNFLHGPIQSLRKDMGVLLIAAPDPMQERMLLAAKVCKIIGAKVALVLPEGKEPPDDCDLLIKIPKIGFETLSPLLYITPLWQLAYQFSLLNRGGHPDRLAMDRPEFKKAISLLK
jgi:glucosamine--fructose-6-phosphate aminotransferase (isomerizing)